MTNVTTRPRSAETPTGERTMSNADIAMDFMTLASSGLAAEAWERYGAPDFRHHNPYFAEDGPTLVAAMDENARQNPDKAYEVKRTISEGPFVAVHGYVRHKPGDRGAALVHIFRIEDGRIRELWDIGQEVPADSPNRSGMF